MTPAPARLSSRRSQTSHQIDCLLAETGCIIGPQRSERGQTNRRYPVDKFSVLRPTLRCGLRRVLWNRVRKCPTFPSGNEHRGGLDVQFALGRPGPMNTSKFDPARLFSSDSSFESTPAGARNWTRMPSLGGRHAFSCASGVHLFDSSSQAVSKPARLFNPIGRTVVRLRPPVRREVKPSASGGAVTMMCRRLRGAAMASKGTIPARSDARSVRARVRWYRRTCGG